MPLQADGNGFEQVIGSERRSLAIAVSPGVDLTLVQELTHEKQHHHDNQSQHEAVERVQVVAPVTWLRTQLITRPRRVQVLTVVVARATRGPGAVLGGGRGVVFHHFGGDHGGVDVWAEVDWGQDADVPGGQRTVSEGNGKQWGGVGDRRMRGWMKGRWKEHGRAGEVMDESNKTSERVSKGLREDR